MSCIECEIQSTVSLPCGCERELLSDGACQLVGYDGDAKKIVAAIEAIGPLVKETRAVADNIREEFPYLAGNLDKLLKPFEG